MRIYLVYDRETGNIVHGHQQGEHLSDRRKEDVLKLVHPSLDRSRLDVLHPEEPAMQPGQAYRVNPNSRTLEPAEPGAGRGASSVQRAPAK